VDSGPTQWLQECERRSQEEVKAIGEPATQDAASVGENRRFHSEPQGRTVNERYGDVSPSPRNGSWECLVGRLVRWNRSKMSREWIVAVEALPYRRLADFPSL
jgi:hypothetical protein